MVLRNQHSGTEVHGASGMSLVLPRQVENRFARRRMEKFMISLRFESYRALKDEADARGISVQELIRAVIIPDWVKTYRQRD